MRYYWKIDFISPINHTDGFSMCVSVETKETEDSIIQLAVENEVIDSEDFEDYSVSAEEITNDSYEMKIWKEDAIEM